MQALYASIYYWAAMSLALLASVAAVISGVVIGWLTINMPADKRGDRVGNIFLATFTLLGSCAASMICLYIGGKFVGTF